MHDKPPEVTVSASCSNKSWLLIVDPTTAEENKRKPIKATAKTRNLQDRDEVERISQDDYDMVHLNSSPVLQS